MTTTVLTIIASLIGIIGGILERRYDVDAVNERTSYERDKEIAEGDSVKLSYRLSNAFDKLRSKGRNSKG